MFLYDILKQTMKTYKKKQKRHWNKKNKKRKTRKMSKKRGGGIFDFFKKPDNEEKLTNDKTPPTNTNIKFDVYGRFMNKMTPLQS